jgi:hypothetical protein
MRGDGGFSSMMVRCMFDVGWDVGWDWFVVTIVDIDLETSVHYCPLIHVEISITQWKVDGNLFRYKSRSHPLSTPK